MLQLKTETNKERDGKHMKINERQKKVLEQLTETEGEYKTAKALAEQFHVSIRTMQGDLAVIKELVSSYEFWQYEAYPSKGSRIIITNEEKYLNFLKKNNIELETLNSRDYRVKNMIAILICSQKKLSLVHLEDRLFISRSTLLNDLKKCEEILKKYNLKIELKQGQVKVIGQEKDIRRMAQKEEMDLLSLNPFNPQKNMQASYFEEISKILTDVFMEYRYNVSDVYLQNFIVHIDIMIHRIQMGFYIEKTDYYEEVNDSREMKMAKQLFARFSKRFHIPILENEIKRLSVYLKGRSAYIEDSYITQEIDEFVANSLAQIKEKQGVDFLSDIWLRNSLALHLVPLLTRLEYNMQVKNEILESIRVEYQTAFDYAAQFSYEIMERYGYRLSEDELSFIAMYFQCALEKHEEHNGSNNVLIISSLKKSETLLLRERIKSWFDHYIASIEIVNPYHLERIDFEKYDLICSTEKQIQVNTQAVYISHFPGQQDYRKIRLMLDGFRDMEELCGLFKFMHIDSAGQGKQEILNQMAELTGENSETVQLLKEEIQKRESIGGSYMGNSLATPHPMVAVSERTSLIVAFLSEELLWDEEEHKVKIIILVNLKKNGVKALRIWSYLSEMLNDTEKIKQLVKEMTPEKFREVLDGAIDTMSR